MEVPEVDRKVEKTIARELLFVALEQHPNQLGMPELVEMIASKDPQERQEEEAVIARVLPGLEEDGLLREKEGRIAPTVAAVRFNELSEIILP